MRGWGLLVLCYEYKIILLFEFLVLGFNLSGRVLLFVLCVVCLGTGSSGPEVSNLVPIHPSYTTHIP